MPREEDALRGALRRFAAGDNICSVERISLGFGFHLASGRYRRLIVGPVRRRNIERALRDADLVIVDRYGARIDLSQFQKEADPTYGRDVRWVAWTGLAGALIPNFVR